MRLFKIFASLLVFCVLFSGCSQMISEPGMEGNKMTSEPGMEGNKQAKEMYVLIGFDQKIVLDSTQQEKLNELLGNWNYSDYCSGKDPCYGGQMFRVVIENSDGETTWAFGENGIAVNSANKDGVFESDVKYDFDATLINKVKYIIFGEDTQ